MDYNNNKRKENQIMIERNIITQNLKSTIDVVSSSSSSTSNSSHSFHINLTIFTIFHSFSLLRIILY